MYRERRTQIAADIRPGVKGGLPVVGRGLRKRKLARRLPRNHPGRCSIASSCGGDVVRSERSVSITFDRPGTMARIVGLKRKMRSLDSSERSGEEDGVPRDTGNDNE